MKTYVVGNWKMNFTVGEASIYLHKLQQKYPNYRDIEAIIAPPMIALQPLSLQLDRKKFKLAAANCAQNDTGSFTGETSPYQLRGITDYVLIGHAERRYLFNESLSIIRDKVKTVVNDGLTPILCIGETESERTFGETADVLRDQLLSALSEVAAEDLHKIIIAYEPVWAISSTHASTFATPDYVATAVDFIRKTLKNTYSAKLAASVPVLFGGSITPSNAGAYLTIPGINGVVLGGSSLIAEEFLAIIDIAKRVQS